MSENWLRTGEDPWLSRRSRFSKEAYKKLKRLKGKGESFTDVILKMDRA